MSKGNVNGDLKLLTINMTNEVLLLSNKSLYLLKHHEPMESSLETLLQGPFRPIHPTTCDDINESLIMRGEILTKGGPGWSGLNADNWQRILHQETLLRRTAILAGLWSFYSQHIDIII